MAIYIQGVPTYSREPKMFTPDYKFLSNILETRQNQFDTNFNKINDLYGRIKYAELMRPETQKARDDFMSKLPTKIEKISGLDLSLQQNVDVAKGVFQPFFDNEYVMKDMINTRLIKERMKEIEELKNHPDQDVRAKYSEEGAKALQYFVEDYMNADINEAMKMNVPNYVERVDLHQMTNQYLKDMGINATITGFTPDGKYKITYENGKAIESVVYKLVEERLGSDPKVREYYRTKGIVNATEAGRQFLNQGQVQTLEEGKLKWAKDKADELSKSLSSKISIQDSQILGLKTSLDKLDNYIKANNLDQSSTIYQEYTLGVETLARMQRELNEDKTFLDQLNKQITTGDNLFNSMIGIGVSASLRDDINEASRIYADKSAKITYDINQDWLNRQTHNQRLAEIKYKADLDWVYKKAELELEASLEEAAKQKENDYANFIGGLLTGVEVSETEKDVDVIGRNASELQSLNDQAYVNQANAVVDYMFNGLDPTAQVKNNGKQIEIRGKTYNRRQITAHMLAQAKGEKRGVIEDLETLGYNFGAYSKALDEKSEALASDPSFAAKYNANELRALGSILTSYGIAKTSANKAKEANGAMGNYLKDTLEDAYSLKPKYFSNATQRMMNGEYTSVFKQNQNGDYVLKSEDEWINENSKVRWRVDSSGEYETDVFDVYRGREKSQSQKTLPKVVYSRIVKDLNKISNGSFNKDANLPSSQGFQSFSVEKYVTDGDGITDPETGFTRTSIAEAHRFGVPKSSKDDAIVLAGLVQALSFVGNKDVSERIGSQTKEEKKGSTTIQDEIKSVVGAYYGSLQNPKGAAGGNQSFTVQYVPGTSTSKSKYIMTVSEGSTSGNKTRVYEVAVPLENDMIDNVVRGNASIPVIPDAPIEVRNGGRYTVYKGNDGIYYEKVALYKPNKNNQIYLDEESQPKPILNVTGKPLSDSQITDHINQVTQSLINRAIDITKSTK